MTAPARPRVRRTPSRAARVLHRLLLWGRALGDDHAADMRLLLQAHAVVDEVQQMLADDIDRAAARLHQPGDPTRSFDAIGRQVGRTRRQVQDHVERGRALLARTRG